MEAFSFCGIHTYECTGSSERYGDDAMYEALTDFSDIYTAYRRTARGKHGKNEVIKYEALVASGTDGKQNISYRGIS